MACMFFEQAEEEIISPGICCTKYILLAIFSPAITILMGSFETRLGVYFDMLCPSGLCLSATTELIFYSFVQLLKFESSVEMF